MCVEKSLFFMRSRVSLCIYLQMDILINHEHTMGMPSMQPSRMDSNILRDVVAETGVRYNKSDIEQCLARNY